MECIVSQDSQSVYGFTLVEIILTLVLMGLLGAMIVPYFQAGVFDSSRLLSEQQNILDLNSCMAHMVADYEENYKNDIGGFSSVIGAENSAQDNAYGQYQVAEKLQRTIAGNAALQLTIESPSGNGAKLSYLFTTKF